MSLADNSERFSPMTEKVSKEQINAAFEAVKTKLEKAMEKYGNKPFSSVYSAMGVVLEEWNEVQQAIHEYKEIHPDVLSEFEDLCVVSLWAIVSFQSKLGEEQLHIGDK